MHTVRIRPGRSPRRFVTLALVAGVGLTLSACNSGPYNRTLNSVHQPVVQRSDYVYDVATDGSGAIAPGEMARVAGWFDALNVGYGDRVSVDDAGSYGGAARAAVSNLAARHGLLVADTAPVTSGAIPSGHVRVVVSRTAASVPSCPDWRDKSASDFIGGTHSNYGCATNTNMAAMIANPEDLLHGARGSGDLNTATSTKAIQSYQAKASTANDLKIQSAKGQ